MRMPWLRGSIAIAVEQMLLLRFVSGGLSIDFR
jgi:hypothetical protein